MSEEDLLDLISELESLRLEELAAKQQVEDQFELRCAVVLQQLGDLQRISRRTQSTRTTQTAYNHNPKPPEHTRRRFSTSTSTTTTSTATQGPQIGNCVKILNPIKLAAYNTPVHNAVGEIIGETAKYKRINVWNGRTNKYKIISRMPHNQMVLEE